MLIDVYSNTDGLCLFHQSDEKNNYQYMFVSTRWPMKHGKFLYLLKDDADVHIALSPQRDTDTDMKALLILLFQHNLIKESIRDPNHYSLLNPLRFFLNGRYMWKTANQGDKIRKIDAIFLNAYIPLHVLIVLISLISLTFEFFNH